MQKDLFGDPPQPGGQKKELIIDVSNRNQLLSKKQKEFNKLVKKLEQLRHNHEQLTRNLDESLRFYVGHLYPLEAKLVALRSRSAKIFYKFHQQKKGFSNTEKKVLKNMMAFALNEILDLSDDEPDDELKAIIELVNDQSYEEFKQDGFEDMKDSLGGMFAEMGFDVNFDDIHAGMSQEEIMQKMAAMKEEMERKARENEAKNAGRKKTKKQLEREAKEKEKEDARNKNISTIYKQLVKVFHPDLETDDSLKAGKEELMKQLTVAYEKNDLHTLLRLEMEWVQREENNIAKLTDSKLQIYNELLKEQVHELEAKTQMMAHHPRYEKLQRYAADPSRITVKHLTTEKKLMKEKLAAMQSDDADFHSADGLKFVKELIRLQRQAAAHDDDWQKMFEELLELKKGGRKR